MRKRFNLSKLPFALGMLFCIGTALELNGLPHSTQEAVITERNWLTHPHIRTIRGIVSTTNSELKGKRLKTAERKFEFCEDSFFTLRRIARDRSGAVKWYSDYSEGEDSAWDYQQYYDPAGRLRFVFVTVYAANGTREQHRYYFNDSGNLIWNNRKKLRGPGYFAPHNIESLVAEDPAKLFTEAVGCKEIKPGRRKNF